MISGTSSNSPSMLALEQELDDRFVAYIMEIEKRALQSPGGDHFQKYEKIRIEQWVSHAEILITIGAPAEYDNAELAVEEKPQPLLHDAPRPAILEKDRQAVHQDACR